MELIDKVELINSLKLLAKFEDATRASAILGIIETVKKQKTVDAVPVVRCGECCYSSFVKSVSKYMCEKCNGFMRYSDDYCSYGERKTDGT